MGRRRGAPAGLQKYQDQKPDNTVAITHAACIAHASTPCLLGHAHTGRKRRPGNILAQPELQRAIMSNGGDWFTMADERELLRFDPQPHQTAVQNEFRALYTKTPGFPPPTMETARAVDFEVMCTFHKDGVKGPATEIKFARKVPAGFVSMMRMQSKAGIVDGIRQAINRKHQFIDVDLYSKSQGYPCCKCGKPQTYIGCKSILFGPHLMMPCSTPQCGGEKCRMECQAEADIMMTQLGSLAAAQGSSSSNPVHALIGNRLASSLGTLGRVCEACAKRDDPDPNGFKNKTCSRCKMAYYCSAACQTKHWAIHKTACKRVSKSSK